MSSVLWKEISLHTLAQGRYGQSFVERDFIAHFSTRLQHAVTGQLGLLYSNLYL